MIKVFFVGAHKSMPKMVSHYSIKPEDGDGVYFTNREKAEKKAKQLNEAYGGAKIYSVYMIKGELQEIYD